MLRPLRLAALPAIAALLALAAVAPAAAAPDLLLILDASGSMWGQIGGENKIVIARRALGGLLDGLPDGAAAGLIAYGHRREGDCADVETVVAMGPLDRAALRAEVEALNPKGKTPITAAIGQAVEVARGRVEPTTVVLVSDGLETCGGDPCRAAGEARRAGVDLVLHVVGFDVGEVDASQLECAAQAGGGLYFDARDADGLAAALEQAVAVPADLPTGRLSVAAIADGVPADALVEVTRASDGERVAGGRTYTGADTNPRLLPLPAGRYDVEVSAILIEGAAPQHFAGIEVKDGEISERVADFSSGELAVEVTHNGALGDATVRVYAAGTGEQVAAGRTYTTERTNPKVFRLAAGTYEVEVKSVEIAGGPGHRFTGVEVAGGERSERAQAFASGTVAIGAEAAGELADAVVRLIDAASGKAVAGGRTYTDPRSNPKRFVVPAGSYRVEVKAVRLEGMPERTIEITLQAGDTVVRTVDLDG